MTGNNEVTKAAKLAELNRLHVAADISDHDYELLRAELLGAQPSPTTDRRRAWPFVGLFVVLAVSCGVAAFVLLSDSSDNDADALPSASSAATTQSLLTVPAVAPASSTRPTESTTEPTRPPSTVPTTVSAERRAFVIDQAYVFIERWMGASSVMNAYGDALNRTQGLLWAPNGLSSSDIGECARERWDHFIDLRPRIERAADKALAEADDPSKVTGVDVRDKFAPGLEVAPFTDADRVASMTFFFECAGYSSQDAAQLAAQ